MGLADIANKVRAQTGRGVGPLLPKIWDRLVQMDKDERRNPRHPFRISSLPGLCPRELALRYLFPKSAEDDAWEPRSLLRVDTGSALHSWWQDRYLGPAGILVGDWECSGCKKQWKRCVIPNGGKCTVCTKPLQYVEMTVSDPETGITGHTDGLLMFGDGEWGFDLKTSNEDSMKNMRQPYEGNIWQLNLYMHLLGVKKGLLVYVDPVCRFWREDRSKAKGLETLPILEFVVEYDRKWWDMAVDKVNQAKKIAEEIRTKTWTGTLPHRICETDKGFRASDCPVAGECFEAMIEKRVSEALLKK